MYNNDQRTRESFIRLPEVCRHTGLGRSTIYRLAQRGDFPKPCRLGPRTSGWRWGEVLDWLDSRQPSAGVLGDRGVA